MRLSDVEKETIIQTLKETGWHITLVAKKLGIGRATLYRKIQLYDIKRPTV